MDKSKSCCIVGDRPCDFTFGYDEQSEGFIQLELKLNLEIAKMITKGVTAFICNATVGVGIKAAELVLKMKQVYTDENITLTTAIAHEKQSERWSPDYKKRYDQILNGSDSVVSVSRGYAKGCAVKRDRFMADSSAHMIAVCARGRTAAQSLVNYALAAGLEVVIISCS